LMHGQAWVTKQLNQPLPL